MGEPEDQPKVSSQTRTTLVILAAFTVVVWIAVEPWSAFVRNTTAPLVPSPEAPRPAVHAAPLDDAPELTPEPEVGRPVAAGLLAVRGRAVDTQGKPVAGALATVRLVERSLPRAPGTFETEARALAERRPGLTLEERARLWRELVWGRTTAELGTASSLKDGRFEVVGICPSPDATLALELRSPASGPLQALAAELHSGAADAREGALGVGHVVLVPLARVTVLVIEGDSRALASARVELHLGKAELLPLVATTGADGTCDLVAPAGEHDLVVSLAGYGQQAVTVRLTGAPESFAIALAPEAR